jgi:hypothetical protein
MTLVESTAMDSEPELRRIIRELDAIIMSQCVEIERLIVEIKKMKDPNEIIKDLLRALVKIEDEPIYPGVFNKYTVFVEYADRIRSIAHEAIQNVTKD